MATYYHDFIRQEIINNCDESIVFIGNYNDNHNNIVCLTYYDSNIDDNISFGKRTIARYPYLQVFVRDTSHQNAWQRMEIIREYFKAYSYQNLSLFPKSDIFQLGKDEKKRTRLIINFNIMLLNGIGIILNESYTYLKDSEDNFLLDKDYKYLI